MDGQSNEKFSILKSETINKSTTQKPMSGNLILIPNNEDIESSQVTSQISL